MQSIFDITFADLRDGDCEKLAASFSLSSFMMFLTTLCWSHLIHAVDPHMRQERPQVGVRQDVILW